MDQLRFVFFLLLFWMPCVPGAKLTPAKRDEQTIEKTVVWPGHYEGTYSNEHDMYWLIQAPEGQKIYLIFWYLPSINGNCVHDSEDFVQIEDEDHDEGKIQIYCTHKPTRIVSQTNQLHIFFVTDQSETSRRFHFHCDFFSEPLLPTLHNSYKCGWTEDRRKMNQEIEELVKRGFNKKEAGEVSWLMRRIFGGKESNHGDWPWLVSIYKHSVVEGEDHICGGSLIHPQWVLTAAHCFEDSDESLTETNTYPHHYILLAGDHSIKENDKTEFSRLPDHIFIHPKRDVETNAYDFALVMLEDPVPLTNHVGLVCLPAKEDKFDAEDNLHCVAAGWGKTEHGDSYNGTARHVDLSIVRNTDCSDLYKGEGADEVASHIAYAEDVLCAGGDLNKDTYKDTYKDTCTGDSGGPLVCEIMKEDAGSVYVLVGVTSAGIECGKGLPGLYGRVTSALPWIYDTVIEHD